MDFGRENSLFPLILIQVKSAAKRTVFGLKDKREKAFLPFKTQLFHIQVVRYAAKEKRFRQDLLYRLQEYVITMPPLRDCPEDIMPLAEFFREMANRELEREVKGFAASARNALLAHAWPGNVRELKQKIQTAVLQSEGDMITEADLELDNEPSATSACFTLKSGDEERGRILRALKQAAGNKKMAAKILGIGRTTLYNKLVEYGLNEEN